MTCYPKCSTSTNKAEKEDIYQFGVILLEVITGKLITSSRKVEELKDEVCMTFFFLVRYVLLDLFSLSLVSSLSCSAAERLIRSCITITKR